MFLSPSISWLEKEAYGFWRWQWYFQKIAGFNTHVPLNCLSWLAELSSALSSSSLLQSMSLLSLSEGLHQGIIRLKVIGGFKVGPCGSVYLGTKLLQHQDDNFQAPESFISQHCREKWEGMLCESLWRCRLPDFCLGTA